MKGIKRNILILKSTVTIVLFFGFVTLSSSSKAQCDGVNTFTDSRDSQVYNMIQIDGSNTPYCLGSSQCWMAENLNVGTRVNDNVNQTNDGTIEKYCQTNLEANCTALGALYNWDEMMAYGSSVGGNGPGPQGICPTGWHVPTNNEWKCLEMNVGMSQAEVDLTNAWRGTDEGTQLKQGGTSGFEALMAGRRGAGGGFFEMGTLTRFWTSTISGTRPHERVLSPSEARSRHRDLDPQLDGFSLRCVRDNAPVPLPVELLYFKANWKDATYTVVELNWETISERNNSHFEIERSLDAINFEYVKSVPGNDISNQNIEYSTLDESPYTEQVSYYRLKQVDKDGTFKYSNIDALNLPEGINLINLYPNPTIDDITILLTSSESAEVIISVKNKIGQEVRTFYQNIYTGFNVFKYSFSELPVGHYVVEVTTSSGTYKAERKFIKANK